MDIETICRNIGLQNEITAQVLAFAAEYPFSHIQSQLSLMCDFVDGHLGYQQVVDAIGDDPDGIKLLSCQLYCACDVYAKYQKKGIPDEIFFDTMRCYVRFIKECIVYRGRPMFDRGWWTWKQISLRVFRLGALEFELHPDGNVAMHIPGGTDFSPERVDEALAIVERFINRYFPQYKNAPFTCNSWLLSPALTSLLPEDSNIRSFQNRFCVKTVDPDARDYISWLFQVLPDTSIECLPERTGLQRRVKQFVLAGGKIGNGFGVLK